MPRAKPQRNGIGCSAVRLLVLLAVLALPACSRPRGGSAGVPGGGEAKSGGEKDLVLFQLPEATRKISPRIQDHFYRLLPYNTPRFQVKPTFVFLEMGGEPRPGPPALTVNQLHFLHFAKFSGDSAVWSGSLLIAPQASAIVATLAGPTIEASYERDELRFVFVDGEARVEAAFPADRDAEQWFESGELRLFCHYYVFPEELIRQDITHRRRSPPGPAKGKGPAAAEKEPEPP